VEHDRLIVMDERVGAPGAVAPRLVDREPGLEVRCPVHLAGDEQHPVEEERRLPILNDLEAGALDPGPARHWEFEFEAARHSDAPACPEVRVQQHRQVGPSQTPGQPVQAHDVVEVPVAEHDGLEHVRGDRQPVEVRHQAVRRDTGVEEHPSAAATGIDLDQSGEPVLRSQEVDRLPTLGHLGGHDRDLAGRSGDAPPAYQPLIGKQYVAGVVHECGDVHAVHGRQCDRLHQARIPRQELP
jgi:hypothetical protein